MDGAAVVSKLIEAFGHQIFAIGKFHSDPHPGNIILCPRAAGEMSGDGPSLALIDFGQSKARLLLQNTSRAKL